MSTLAARLDSHEVIQEIAKVVSLGRQLTVRGRAGLYHARRGVSCLVAPALGDMVLVALSSDGRCWVLAVLERPDRQDERVEISVDGDLDIRSAGGRLGLSATEGMSLVSGHDVAVVAGSVAVNAVEGSVVVERLRLLGGLLQTEVERVKTLAKSIDLVLDRFSQRVKRSYRQVEELDQLRAERIDHVASGTMSLRGDNALMTARKLAKIDGEQVHLG